MEEKDKNIENFSNENDIEASNQDALSSMFGDMPTDDTIDESMFGDMISEETIDESMFGEAPEIKEAQESVLSEDATEISEELQEQIPQEIPQTQLGEEVVNSSNEISEEIQQETNTLEAIENFGETNLEVDTTENQLNELPEMPIKNKIETHNDISPILSDSDEFEEPIKELITVRPVKFQQFEETEPNRTIKKNLDILQDISMHVSVELGRTKTSIREVMEMESGSIVELDKIAGEQVEIFVNEKLVAKGEVIVIEDKFGVRITSTSITNPSQNY